ncbi:hypothetical protein Tsubulata_028050, partial [Turnera subulata]
PQMTDYPIPPEHHQEQQQQQTMIAKQEAQESKRLCDYCNDTTALLYCRADSAKLCLSCDREVHSTNQLFSKHTRSQLCDGCDASPASIFCETEHSVLCQNCDWERHSISRSPCTHNRRPIEGFSGCPTPGELVTFMGFEDLGPKKPLFPSEGSGGLLGSGLDGLGFGDDYSDLFVWDSPAVVSIDDLIVSSDSGQKFQALGNRNAVCGQHKEEILSQLHQLLSLEPDLKSENKGLEYINTWDSLDAGHNLQPRNTYTTCEPAALPDFEETLHQWCNDTEEAGNQAVPSASLKSNFRDMLVVPDKQSGSGGSLSHANDDHEAQPQNPSTARALSLFPKVAPHELNSQERDSAISRYKEKKKTRRNNRYDKHIRYESRKARAESRTRIRGRFAKIER